MLHPLASSFASIALFVPLTAAQTVAPNAMDFNWAPLAQAPQVSLPGPFLFSHGMGTPSLGGAIRRCYSVDVTQDGRNERGSYETTWITFAQGFAASSPIPGVNVGLVSIQSATDSVWPGTPA